MQDVALWLIFRRIDILTPDSPRLATDDPPLVTAITPFNLVLAMGELVLVVWLLVRGVDNARWHAQAAATYQGTFVSS